MSQQKDSLHTVRNKRFIAAAVCPQCQTMDTIFTFSKDFPVADSQWRACASCNFEEMFAESNTTEQELTTRVNQNRIGEKPLAHEVSVDAVKIIE